MQGWLIYNGANEIAKISILINKLKFESEKIGYKLSLIKSNEIFPYFDSNCEPKIEFLNKQSGCDYIIFWDKDIFLAKHLETMGYKVFNSSDAIAKCDDKLLMHQYLSNSGIRIPKTVLGPFAYFEQKLDEVYYNEVKNILGDIFIIKEAYGSFGMQVYLIKSYEEYLKTVKELGNKRFLLQECIISSIGRDLRINIIGDKIVGAMERRNTCDFRANITLGGKGEPIDLTDNQMEIAIKAHKQLGLDFSGVDLLYGPDEEPILCEVNSNVNYISYEDASGVNFSKQLLEYMIGCVK